MARKQQKLSQSADLPDLTDGEADAYAESMGNAPEVSPQGLEVQNRTITSVDQAVGVIEGLEFGAQKLVKNAGRITSLKQGRKPYDSKKLEKQGKGYKLNISPGTFSTTLRRVAPRLYMPLLQASTLTAAELPAGTINAEEKQNHYREVVTRAIRSWPRWQTFVRLLAQEVVDYGFAFAAFTDPFEWQPHLCRMDRGFVPAGTEIMDLSPSFFAMKWDYQPDQLIGIVKDAEDAGVAGWDKEAVAKAVQASAPSTAPQRDPVGWRKWEELVREQVWSYGTSKNYRVIETTHLFALEASGKVSHYILNVREDHAANLLYEKHDAFEKMSDAVIPVTFNSTDGTIHGSWGAGHLLYDLGGLSEKIFCDMVDNLRNANKQRLQVNDPKDINDVKQVVNDTEVIVSGAQFANNMGGVQQNVEAYIKLRDIVQQTMDSKVGAYVPPIPTQSSDVKAAQVNAAMQQEKEVSDDSIEFFLSQIAFITHAMSRRLTDPSSPNDEAKEVLKRLREKLTDDEINTLRQQPVIRSVAEFTPMAAQARAQFAAQFLGNQLYKQTELARLTAEGVPFGGTRLASLVVIPDGDQTQQTVATRDQITENTTMMFGVEVPVAITDNHWVHMQALKQPLIEGVNAKQFGPAQVALKHYAQHWATGVAQKVLPPDQINTEKSFIADVEKAIKKGLEQQQQEQMLQQQMAQQQQMPQMQGGGMSQGQIPGLPGEQGMPVQQGVPEFGPNEVSPAASMGVPQVQ
jgi:hypothetical protein